MKTAKDFLSAIKAKHGLTTDYQLAKFLGWRQQRITLYNMGSTFDDTTAAQVADALDIDPGQVVTRMAVQRAQTPEARKIWEKVAKTVSAGTGLALALALAYAVAPDSMVLNAQAFDGVTTVYYVKLASLVFAIVSVSYLYFATVSPTSARVQK